MTDFSLELTDAPCGVCGSDRSRDFAEENGFRLARCGECGFIFVNPRPTEASMARLYADPERNMFGSDAYEPLEFEQGGLIKLAKALQKQVSSGRLLEIGCGRGDFLGIARSLGFEVAGCDFFGGVKPGLEGVALYDGSLKAARLPSASWDIVVLRLTLEHLFTPRDELGEIHRVLKPGGILYVKVPNVRFEHGLPCRLMYRRGSLFGTPYHLNHFSPATLALLLKKSGFTPLKGFVEQPSRRANLKADLPRQAFYRMAQALSLLTGGRLYPKVVLSGTSRKAAD